MGIFKDRIDFDTADADGIDKIRSYVSTASGLLTSTLVGADESLDVAAYLRDSSGALFTGTTEGAAHGLDVNVINELTAVCELDGVYDDPDNVLPDSAGMIAHVRDAAPDVTHQTFRSTGASPTSDAITAANVFALDTNAILHGWNGTTLERIKSSAGAVGVGGSIADDAADAGDPIKIGSRTVDAALTEVSAAGDRADLLSDMYRRIYVNDAPNVALAYGAASVTDTAAVLVAANSGRRRILVQNLGSSDIFLGGNASVTTANGLRVSKNSTFEIPIGENVPVYAIATSGTPDVRYMQLA